MSATADAATLAIEPACENLASEFAERVIDSCSRTPDPLEHSV